VLKPKVALQANEIIDATFMSKRALRHSSRSRSKTPRSRRAVLASHESHDDEDLGPKIFGHAVTVYYKDVFEKHGETLKKLA